MTLKIFPIHIYRRYTVNNKKKTHPPPVFQPFVFPIYDISLEPLELQKIDIHLFLSLSEELSAEKGIFQITKSADICKKLCFARNSKVLEKIRHFEKFKNIFLMDGRLRN